MLDRQGIIRIAPFALFIIALAIEDLSSAWFGADTRWQYAARAGLAGAALLLLFRNYEELRQLPAGRLWLWLAAPAAGALVFVLWINLDQEWLKLGQGSGFDPRQIGGGIDWLLASVRLAGAVLVIPLMEEIFWRSFLMRWIDRHDFLKLAPAQASIKAVLVSSLVFGFAHSLWFAGFLAGLAYAWLYRASGSIWPPVFAHAVTNALLGVWVLQTSNWQFW